MVSTVLKRKNTKQNKTKKKACNWGWQNGSNNKSAYLAKCEALSSRPSAAPPPSMSPGKKSL
jgi:hypothetical protein